MGRDEYEFADELRLRPGIWVAKTQIMLTCLTLNCFSIVHSSFIEQIDSMVKRLFSSLDVAVLRHQAQ